MARWDEERGRWEGRRERHGHEEHGHEEHGPRRRDERGGWRSDDTWRGGGWREAEDWRRDERGEGGFEGLGREYGGRAEWDRLRERGPGWGHAGGRYAASGGWARGGEPEEGGEGGWRRSTQFEPSGEGPGSWGPEGRYRGRERLGREEWGRDRGREYGGFMGGMAERYGEEEGRGRWEARSDFGRGSERGHEYRGRSDWGRGGEDRGPMERLGERMKEGWRKMTGRGPKGYKRSDERIREDLSERIARSDLDASEVEVKVEHGEVTLTGSVESRWDKRMLEDVADDVFGVEEVHNHLRLRRAEPGEATVAQAGQAGMSGQTLPGQQARPQAGQARPDAGARRH